MQREHQFILRFAQGNRDGGVACGDPWQPRVNSNVFELVPIGDRERLAIGQSSRDSETTKRELVAVTVPSAVKPTCSRSPATMDGLIVRGLAANAA